MCFPGHAPTSRGTDQTFCLLGILWPCHSGAGPLICNGARPDIHDTCPSCFACVLDRHDPKLLSATALRTEIVTFHHFGHRKSGPAHFSHSTDRSPEPVPAYCASPIVSFFRPKSRLSLCPVDRQFPSATSVFPSALRRRSRLPGRQVSVA